MKLIDISHMLSEQTPVYPGDSPLTLTKITSLEEEDYTSYLLSSTLHTSTHIDVPMHLLDDPRMVCDFSADNFVGAGVLLDVRGQTEIAMNPKYEKLVTQGSIVLLYTGFDEHYGSKDYFTSHPAVGRELGDFLLSANIKMLGMDMPSPDHSPYVFHKKLLERGILLLENLTNLGALSKADKFEVMAFPLKIFAEASFVRAVCKVL